MDALTRDLVAFADDFTQSLQATVTHRAVVSRDAYNKPTYDNAGAGTSRTCLLEYQTRSIRQVDGTEKLSIAKLTFPRPLTIGLDDKMTLPDGTSCLVIGVSGLADPDTTGRFVTEVWLG